MSGTIRIDQWFDWRVTALPSGSTAGVGTAELTVTIKSSGDLMPDGSALSRRVRELFTQALADALPTEERNVTVARRGPG